MDLAERRKELRKVVKAARTWMKERLWASGNWLEPLPARYFGAYLEYMHLSTNDARDEHSKDEHSQYMQAVFKAVALRYLARARRIRFQAFLGRKKAFI